MGFSFRQFEIFYWAGRLGSFSAAAERLNTSQPAVSTRIRELERTIGATLFERTGKLPQLTPRGRELMGYVERLMGLLTEMQQRMADRASLRGLVRVGVVDTIALTWLPRLVARLARDHAALEIELVVDLSRNLAPRLLSAELDIAFLVGPVSGPDVRMLPLGSTGNAWVASPSLGVPGGILAAADIAKWPILSHTRGSHHSVMVQDWLRAGGARPVRLHGCSSLATLIRLTASGLGLSILAPGMLTHEIDSGELRIVRTRRRVPRTHYSVAFLASNPEPAIPIIAGYAIELGAKEPIFLER